jgi:hypothetical protein
MGVPQLSLDAVTYVLPIKRLRADDDPDLDHYLRRLSSVVTVVVADGSPSEVAAANARHWGASGVRHLLVTSTSLNGKVAGVCDGVLAAETPYVILADDDVRYDQESLQAVADRLTDHDVVVPQNFFQPLPWHAQWDTSRALVNRAFGVEYAGTMGLRRELLLTSRGYCGGVLFENLELLRTLRAHGSRPHHALDVFVVRRPPSVGHFVGQRVRQAYDSQAQPARLVVELSVLPLVLLAAPRRRPLVTALVAALAVLLAEVGRRRGNGTRVFAASSAGWAPLWLLERALCSWLALASAARGGARYSGRRLRRAAHRTALLGRDTCPEPACGCDIRLRLTSSFR